MSRTVKNAFFYLLLALMALAFFAPFYFMLVGAFQQNPTNTPSDLLPTDGWTLQNFVSINQRISLLRSIANSLVFALGVLAGTLSFGLLAGYALARLQWRGRTSLFVVMLGVQMIPFQLLMIPLYVQVASYYQLGDTHAGMILPFLINTTAVFIFRQFFRALPESIFEAARIDGASELRVLWSVAIPMVKPAIATVVLITFIGPWNEFLWPFLITKDASIQPLAVALANFISNAARAEANPNGVILAGACALALPVVVLFCLFQKHFRPSDLGAGIKG
ncbi:ABC-type sugar transport system, permease component [Brachybacterium faecium DSM 4810]|uniref:ABC-type sugar transport system, permease component n=1 Tax=Brachybacterium faecium (strain ATCC 43885 / DSM 4810 / JCM 11609 / LMG 19847 / NBRC 14762 / NCIMB 9860 / 6-10) TaxID=446465 RepID=C7MHF1_BRAFD|nr:carbohydrate ABC transporter permease [Brachybacterium faecium]ACU84360.1 ABC-type sugar transport system, permease component [Brachybacterium faecium DSM 4810]